MLPGAEKAPPNARNGAPSTPTPGRCLPGGGEQTPRVGEQLREHLGLADDGHEVGVAAPPRHQVLVQVRSDAGAGGRAGVDADVEPVRSADRPYGPECVPGEFAEL